MSVIRVGQIVVWMKAQSFSGCEDGRSGPHWCETEWGGNQMISFWFILPMTWEIVNVPL
jgi:hypothetical protein